MQNPLLVTLLSFTSFFLHSQGTPFYGPGTTRAVVIGISDYQDSHIPDLNYADKDAEAFAAYLQSPAGGNVPPENLKLLLNEQATMAAIAGELDWLVEASQAEDQAIIYFSGHGDVEAKTARQPGFLLTYDSPSKIYIAGAYPLFYLQLIIETLSLDKNVQTLVITDACRAGKLAGSEIGGTQATAANLAKQYANEIKILSCQPDEFSLEGQQWGGGRGVFSYHLIEGLIGLADKNHNYQVNLLELENYLEEVVPLETAPQSQIPMTVGSKGTPVAFVDKEVLAELRSLKERELPTLDAIASKGVEETLLASADSLIQQKYQAFLAALEAGDLLEGREGSPSADALYRELIEEESLASLHSLMTRKYATALQDDAQQAINAYLLANPVEMEKRWKGDTTYSLYPRYLQRAAELLGEGHYMHDYLIAKKLYFEGLNLRLQIDQGNANSSYQDAIEKLEGAIALEDRAAYFFNELGALHTRLKLDDKAFEYYEKAIELAPEWGLPHVNYSLGLFYNGQYEASIKEGEKALQYLPQFPQMYNFLAYIYANEYDWLDKQQWKRTGIDLSEGFYLDENNVHTVAQLTTRYQKPIELLEKAREIDSSYFFTFYNLGIIYWQLRKYEESESALKRALQIDSTSLLAQLFLGRLYLGENKTKEAKAVLLKGLDNAQSNLGKAVFLNTLQWAYSQEGDLDASNRALLEAIEVDPAYVFPYLNLGNRYLIDKEYQKSERTLLKGLKNIPNWPALYIYLIKLYSQTDRTEEIEFFSRKGLEIKPDNTRLMGAIAEYYQQRGQYEKALEWLEKRLELSPEDSYALGGYAGVSYLSKRFKPAETTFQKAVQLDSLNWSPFNKIGNFYRHHSEYEKAKAYLTKAHEMNPPERYPYINLAIIHFDEGLENEGIAWLDTAWVKFQDPMVYYFKMYLQLHSENYAQATEELQRLIGLQKRFEGLPAIFRELQNKNYERVDSLIKAMPDSLSNLPYYFQARVQAQLGHPEKAIELLSRDIALFPYRMILRDTFFNPLHGRQAFEELLRKHFPEKYDDLDTFEWEQEDAASYYPENCVSLANYYVSQGELDRARFLYEKAIELRPDTLTDELALALAEAYLYTGDLETARSICPEAIESNDVNELFATATLYFHLDKPELAEAHFAKYLARSRQSMPLNTIGWFYKNQGTLDLAVGYFNREIEANPAIAHPRRNLARAYFFHGQPEKAKEILEKANEDLPGDLSTVALKALLTYYQDPQAGRAELEQAESLLPGILQVWYALELMRTDRFEAADAAWTQLQADFDYWWLEFVKYKYLQMKVRQGETGQAVELMKEMLVKGLFFNYHWYHTDPELDPLREDERFKELMGWYFPGRGVK